MKRERKGYLIGGLLTVGYSILFQAIPLEVRHVVGALERDPAHVLGPIRDLVLISIVFALVRLGSRLLMFRVGRDIEYDIRNEYFAHLQRLPQSFFDSPSHRRPDVARGQRHQQRAPVPRHGPAQHRADAGALRRRDRGHALDRRHAHVVGAAAVSDLHPDHPALRPADVPGQPRRPGAARTRVDHGAGERLGRAGRALLRARGPRARALRGAEPGPVRAP